MNQENVNASFASFMQTNASVLQHYEAELNGFLNSDFSTANMRNYMQRNGINTELAKAIPAQHIRPDIALETGIINFREEYYGDDNLEQRKIEYEAAKQRNDFVNVEKRIKANIAAGNQDPVFSSVEEFYVLVSASSDFLNDAQQCVDPTQDIFRKDPKLARTLCNEYIGDAKAIRYYCNGYTATVNRNGSTDGMLAKIYAMKVLKSVGFALIVKILKDGIGSISIGALRVSPLGFVIGATFERLPIATPEQEFSGFKTFAEFNVYLLDNKVRLEHFYNNLDTELRKNETSLCNDPLFKALYNCK